MADPNLGKTTYTQPKPGDGDKGKKNAAVIMIKMIKALKHGIFTHADVHEIMTMQGRLM